MLLSLVALFFPVLLLSAHSVYGHRRLSFSCVACGKLPLSLLLVVITVRLRFVQSFLFESLFCFFFLIDLCFGLAAFADCCCLLRSALLGYLFFSVSLLCWLLHLFVLS